MPLTPSYAHGVKVSWVDNGHNHLLWDDCVLEDASGNQIRDNAPGSLRTMNINATGGANGLDTGSPGDDLDYWVWLISDGTNFNGLYSRSDTSPVMPSGYTYKLLVGRVLLDGSGLIIPSLQVGNRVEYITPQQIVGDTNLAHNATNQTTSLCPQVPIEHAWEVELQILISATYSAATQASIAIRAAGVIGGASYPKFLDELYYFTNAGTFQRRWTGSMVIINEKPDGGVVIWRNQATDTNLTAMTTLIYVVGYRLTSLLIS